MTVLVSGTVTFLFTDIEGSTRLVQDLGNLYSELLADHHRLVRAAFAEHGGIEAATLGDGLFYTFASARAAVNAAVAAQRNLTAHDWPAEASVRVRMGLHTGEPESVEPDYVGVDVNVAARICAAAHGGQILLSGSTQALIVENLPPGITLTDLGEHRLKDIIRPLRVFQLTGEGLPPGFASLQSSARSLNNLPRQLTSFVGRGSEIADVGRLLAAGPLVTITGPGGVGKTRLAVEVGARLSENHPDGVWLVELAEITDPTLVPHAVAGVLGCGDQPGRPLLENLINQLGRRELLLLLDNCEHLLAACAAMAHALLRACSSLVILTTSRQALDVAGENLYPLAPLAVPDPSRRPSLATLGSYEAIRLFSERAQAVLPRFALNEDNAGSVISICRRLDGIPLAIELAAARVKALSAEAIAARLDDRFRLLGSGSRATLPHHRTLRAVLDWSYDLLTEPERAVLRRVSVFAGGFTLDAAEAVCEGNGVSPSEVVDLVSALVDKSLIVSDDDPTGRRYRLQESVRQYGWDLLAAAGEPEDTQRRHRDWYLALVELATPEFQHGPESKTWLKRLDQEHDNLRAALRWSAEEPVGDQAGLRMAAGLWRFWEIRGYLVEGRTWMERMLARAAGEVSALRADTLTGAGVLAYVLGDYEAAFSFHEESLALHRRLDNTMSVATALSNLGSTATRRGDYGRARALYEEGVDLSRRLGDQRGTAFTLINLADVAAKQGEHDSARHLYEESVGIFEELKEPWGTAYAFDNFGVMAFSWGDLELASSVHQRAAAIYQRIGDGRGEARTLSHLGDIAHRRGDLDEARTLYQRSLKVRFELGERAGIASALERLAKVADAGESRKAATLLAAAGHLREIIRAPLPAAERDEYERSLDALRTLLGEEEFSAAVARGRDLPVEDAVALAVSESEPY